MLAGLKVNVAAIKSENQSRGFRRSTKIFTAGSDIDVHVPWCICWGRRYTGKSRGGGAPTTATTGTGCWGPVLSENSRKSEYSGKSRENHSSVSSQVVCRVGDFFYSLSSVTG